jgi:hypothetical protein
VGAVKDGKEVLFGSLGVEGMRKIWRENDSCPTTSSAFSDDASPGEVWRMVHWNY